jgi:predicted methyltransferase
MVRASLLLIVMSACGASTTTPATPSPSTPTHEIVKDVTVSPAIKAIIEASDRSAEDRALDGGRHPGEMLAFFGIAPGMKVAEIGAGSGYTSELLARAVGESGKVFGTDNKFFLSFAEGDWSKRLAMPAMKNTVRVDREFDDPLPPEAKDLDAVFIVLVYHDFVWLKVDREKMNHAIFAALKPGGTYAIIDHSARAGAGINEVQTTHRIEESSLIDDVTKAGFKLVSEAQYLRNPGDARDWNDSPRIAGNRRGTSDRFVLKFTKP